MGFFQLGRNLLFVEKLTGGLFQRRAVRDGLGNVYFRLRGRHYVRLSEREWDWLGGQYRRRSDRYTQRLMRELLLGLVFSFAVLVAYGQPAIGRALDALAAISWWLGTPLFVCGPALVALVRHAFASYRQSRRLWGMMAARETCVMPGASPPRLLELFELLGLFLVGPWLVVETIGTLAPHLWDHSWFDGARLGWFGCAGLAVLVPLTILRRRASRWCEGNVAAMTANRLDFVATRARRAADQPIIRSTSA